MKRNSGFSLVELMISVAIVGMLASMAVPSFQRARGKAMQTEGRTVLSQAFTAEKIYKQEYNRYTSEFDQLSLNYNGPMHYNLGFAIYMPDTTAGAPPHPAGGHCCSNACDIWHTIPNYPVGTCNAGFTAQVTWTCNMPWGNPNFSSSGISPTTFDLQVVGRINGKGVDDIWELDDHKSLTNPQSGL